MTESVRHSDRGWLDPADEAPELTDALLDVAEVSVGGAVIGPATGYLGPEQRRARPTAAAPLVLGSGKLPYGAMRADLSDARDTGARCWRVGGRP
ncbi:hypothetical protein [Sphingomonas sp. CARO-RG-8B-R24-01]|uniref:hypothetical protein n=1 Tax=Sphingomonas sp. CARO-RG-8B-R24-01 TaxID=2914831 RepID=UPI001F569838|nr:hypothetical protein [Sphingomonas sp. CARO-RG-8B-R24-01]